MVVETTYKTEFYVPDVNNRCGPGLKNDATHKFVADSLLPRFGSVDSTTKFRVYRAEDESIQAEFQDVLVVFHSIGGMDLIREVQGIYFKRFNEPLERRTYPVEVLIDDGVK